MSSLINLGNLAQTENQQHPHPTSSESITNPLASTPDARTLRVLTRNNRDEISRPQQNQLPPAPSWEPPSSPLDAVVESEEEEDASDVESNASSTHSSPHQPNRDLHRDLPTTRDFNHNLQPELPNLEALQQIHDYELLTAKQSHVQYTLDLQRDHTLALQTRDAKQAHLAQELAKRDALLAKALATEKRLRARAKQQILPEADNHGPAKHHASHDPNYETPYNNTQQPESHRGSPPDALRGLLKPSPTNVSPTRLRYPTTRDVSPTRSHMSLDSLDGRKPDTRTTAGLKHIKIDIAQLHLNQNELEWRKTVTAATAALKMPHLLEDNYRPYTHAKLGELYESLNLELPTHLQTPTKLTPSRASATPAKPSWWVAATKAKGDTFAQQATSYTDRIIEQDLRFVVVWVTVGDDDQPEIESDYDSECRTILFTHMKKSLKTYAHMTKDVVHGDCRALFNAVVLQHNPEPRQLLVSCFRQLVKHEKTAAQPYQPWVTGLNDIFNTLDTVDFTLAPHVRLGFTIALLESDKRYAPILEKAQEKEWTNEECQIYFNRHAAKLSDQIKTTRIPTPHSTNAIGDPPPARPPKGGGKGDKRDAKGGRKGDKRDRPPAPNPTPPATPTVKPDLSDIATAQKWIDAQRAKRAADQARKPRDPARAPAGSTPCLNYANGRPCYSDPCPFSHLIGPDTTKKADPAYKRLNDAERELAVANRECFMFKANKHCSNGDTCNFKHEANMVTAGWANQGYQCHY